MATDTRCIVAGLVGLHAADVQFNGAKAPANGVQAWAEATVAQVVSAGSAKQWIANMQFKNAAALLDAYNQGVALCSGASADGETGMSSTTMLAGAILVGVALLWAKDTGKI